MGCDHANVIALNSPTVHLLPSLSFLGVVIDPYRRRQKSSISDDYNTQKTPAGEILARKKAIHAPRKSAKEMGWIICTITRNRRTDAAPAKEQGKPTGRWCNQCLYTCQSEGEAVVSFILPLSPRAPFSLLTNYLSALIRKRDSF